MPLPSNAPTARVFASFFLAALTSLCQAGSIDGPLRMEVITAYNFVVDSNVESPSTNGPSAAHLGVKIYNDGATPLTNVVVRIGDLTDPPTSAGTPGTFPSRTVTVGGANGYSGTFSLQMPGGAADAVRLIPVIQPGEYAAQYFFVTYPLKDGSGNSVAGAAPDPTDDLWLNYDIWASADEGVTTRRVDQTTKVTMRNEISAMANKIWPNTTGKVPDEYLDAIQAQLGWRPDANAPRTGTGVRLEGIWYDLGNVGAGFDNNGDGVPDRNAWMQPVGDPTPSLYNPLAVRLTKCYGLLIIKLNDGTEQLIAFEDQLYFENIAANNNGAVGLVYYEFMPLAPNTSTTLSPYQEVASGYDNEKFNGDYGTPGGSFTSEEPEISFDKNGAPVVGAGTTATYTMTATNNGAEGIGFPGLSLPLIFEDAIPSGLVYVAGSAASSNAPPAGRAFVVSWSTDNGATWATTEPAPASVTTIRWTLDGALDPNAAASVQFQAAIPITYPAAVIDNTGCIKLGPTGDLACDTYTSFISGINSTGDLVWRDDDRDSVKDAGEPGIANITVTLYYDADGDGALDAGEPLFGTAATNGSGIYSFPNLPDAKFIAIVDENDADLPAGYTLPNSTTAALAVDLDSAHASPSPVNLLSADWPFISALEVTKSITPTTYGEGDLLTYMIDLENFASAVPPPSSPEQTAWSATVTAGRAGQNPANAQGSPDNVYANGTWSSGTDYLDASGLAYSDPSGTITKVEMVFETYLSSALGNDLVHIRVNGNLVTTIGAAELNGCVGAANETLAAIDITSIDSSWTWAEAQALVGRLEYDRIGPNDGSTMNVDSIGFRVTTTVGPPPSGSYGPTTIDPLPLTDTYDASKLQYVSASLLPTSTSAGTITWANAGPLNAGARKTITVTFRALTPPDIDADNEPDPTTTINTAAATGAKFVNGRDTNDDSSNVTVTINPQGEIGDFVFWDLDADGVHDGGEPGLANVRVTLSNGAETRTDGTGFYLFRSLADGSYTITIDTTTLPFSSFTQTKDPDGTFNNASTVTINNNNGNPADDGYLDRDFGYDSTLNVITGAIFQDNNGDGDQDAGENFLSGLTVTLLRDADSNGSYETTHATTATNSSGFYAFNSLPNGLFRVVVTQPGATTQTLDPDLPPGNTSGDNATNENASGGNLYANNDFAYQPAGALALGDTLYLDWNGDGDQDSGEDGIANVDVLLYEDADSDGVIDSADDALIATTTTSASGGYSFTGLVADDYIVVVAVSDPQFPSGVIQTQDYDGTLDGRAEIALAASNNNVDFGYQPQGTGSIGDIVFLDVDGDGVKDAGESGMANITVTLYEDTNDNGAIDAGTDAVVGVDVSDSSGAYLFTGLPAGAFLVDVDQTDADLPEDALGFSYRRTTTDPHDVALGAGQAYLAADFGFAAAAAIGDMVFFDANNNATQDYSEAGVPNVSVELWADNDEDGQPDVGGLLATTTTADGSGAEPAGFYRFNNLAAGHYFVKVDTDTLPQAGGQPIDQTADPDRDGIPIGDPDYPAAPPGDHGDSDVIVALGANYGGADFGYQPAGVLGDFVWLDLNQDGVQDPGESGISGVTIQITDGVATYNATTDFDGYWSVANIADGSWTITVPASNFNAGGPLENTTNTFDADGGANASVIAVINGGIVGPAGNPWCSGPDGSLEIDFGFAINGSYSIAGTVVIHDTGVAGTADDPDIFAEDGVDQDLGPDDESELAGVPVYLFRSDGGSGWDFIGATTTDSRGNYSFSGLPDDDYRVIIPTTAVPLSNAALTTTTANASAINPEVTNVNDTGASVIQSLTLNGEDVANVDFAFLSTVDYDFGDLPDDFGITTLAQDGARHIIPGGGSTLYFGSAPDADLDGAPGALANGDDTIGIDDEGGVLPLNITSWTNGTAGGGNGGQVAITLTVPAGGGWLVGYMDFNQDNDFLDAGELILSQAVTTSGTADYAFDIPAGTIDGTEQSFYARFRILADEPPLPVFAFAGEAADGEVEDYLFTKFVGASIGSIVWADADGDGVFDPAESGLGGLTIQLSGDATASMTTSDGTQDVDNDGIIDPRGYYRFTGLGAGSYAISFTAPAGYTPSYDEDGDTGSPDTNAPVALAIGEQHLTADFGLEPLTASISGQVRDDLDSDGDLGDPDSGIPYVIVRLFTDPDGDGDPSDGAQAGEALTNATGHYAFDDVPTGDYVIIEIDPSGAASTADVSSPNDNRIPVALVGGADSTGNDFLDHLGPVHSISGAVYLDGPSDDNTFGPDDTALPYALISLYRDINNNGFYDVGEPLLAQTLTNAAGSYAFTGLTDADYIVIESDPPGATSEADTEGLPTDNAILVVLAGNDSEGNDFLDDGVSLYSLTGHVYHDYPADGALDGMNEQGIAGVAVTLYADLNSDGLHNGGDMLIGSAFTDASGFYSFDGLPPGNYVVEETDPPGAISRDDVTGDNLDNNVSATIASANSTGNDFLDDNPNQPGSISGAVLADTDNDDAGDSPMQNVAVALFTDPNGDGDPADGAQYGAPQLTLSDGSYIFSQVAPGSYVIVETQPAGYLTVADADDIADAAGSPADAANASATDNRIPVNIQAGELDEGNHFVEEQAAAVGNLVWIDSNNDGIKDGGESGLDGVVLELLDGSGNSIDSDPNTGGIQPTTTITSGGGAYSFGDLPPGSYQLRIAAPPVSHPISSTTTDTNDNGEDNDDNGGQAVAGGVITSPVFALAAGETETSLDFGLVAGASIGNRVWHDANNDGIKDGGESGIDGVGLALFDGLGNAVDDPHQPGVQAYTVTTAGGGDYTFTHLVPGAYRVRIPTAPAAYPLSSTNTDTSDNGEDEDDNGSQSTPSAPTASPLIVISHGESEQTVDFGFAILSGAYSISGQVRDDFDLDGNFSDADQPVPGVTVRLYADSNENGACEPGIDLLLGNTTTNGLGIYSFIGLPDGAYFVEETDPRPSSSTADIQGANDNLVLAALSGGDSTGNDFLDAVDPAGYIYDVVTGQIIAGGSIAVSGPGSVTILLDGSTGQYSFITDGTLGSYTITYTPPMGYLIDPARPVAGPSFDPTGGPDPTVLGSAENPANPGYLTDSTAPANPYYFTFVLEPGDPLVINNNVPLRLAKPKKYIYWKEVIPGGGPTPGSNGDGDCYTDLIEYALDLDPSTGVQTTPAFRGTHNTITGKVDAMFNRVSGGLDDVTYTLMGLTNLAASPGGWTALIVAPTITDNGDGTETVTFADLESHPFFSGLDHGLVRLSIALDEDGDTVPEVTANTPVFGWTRRTFQTECVMTGHPYLKDKLFCGAVDDVSGNSLDVTASAGGQSIAAQFIASRKYFIEVYSGDHAGQRFEIDEAASTTTAIALEPTSDLNTLPSIPASLAGDKVVIREHWTLNGLFSPAQFGSTNNASTADRLLFYNRNTTTYDIYWLFANAGSPKWVLLGDATLADQGGHIMEPCEGWFTHPKGSPQEVVWHGMVRANPFACPLRQGPNFIGDGWPMDQTPAMRGMTTAAGFIGTRDPATADQILFWKGDSGLESLAYYSHFLLNYGALQQWTEVGNAALANENNDLMFHPTTGSIYKMRSGLSGYVMPMPWTP